MSKKRTVPPEVSAFFREVGKRNGKALFEKRGSQYFKDLAAKRKIHGRQKPKPEVVPEAVSETPAQEGENSEPTG